MSIQIKQANVDSVAFLAQMMLDSSRAGKKDGLFDLLFHTNDDKVIKEYLEKLLQTKVKSYCHYKNFLIAELNGKQVGTLCTYEPRLNTKESFVEALYEIGLSDDIMEVLNVVNACDFDMNKNTLIFDFMEELEGFVDVGVLKALMQKALLGARLKGYAKAHTLIEIGSLESELFYKKLGFKEVAVQECEGYRELFGRNGLMLLALEF